MRTNLSQETINDFVVASHSDLPKIKSMLEQHPDLLNENADWMETPIQAASHVGNIEIAEFLLAQGAPLDICTAAMLGQAEEVRAMLADDPELSDAHGAHNLGVLFFPALVGNIEIAEILYAAGAEIDPPDSQSPLIGSIVGKQPAMLQWLLDHDADPYAKDFNGHLAIDVAESNHFDEGVNILQTYYEADEDDGESGDAATDEP